MNTRLQRLHDLGQSIWYDNIRRALLDSGRLAEYVEEYAVTGVTSNPTIFERAISGGSDYDAALRDALDRGTDAPEALFWDLAVRDIQDAADVLRVVHDASDGTDGFVSLELPPRLSHDADRSVEFGAELFARLDRPNVMIKVPGTPEGVGAVEELTAWGVHVNVTLLFSLPQWQGVSDAYLRGLERRAADGQDLRVASVASYFISRIDSLANDRLPGDLRNRLGVASAQLAYAAYSDLLASERWTRLAERGARPQRLLWASTSTKDPALPETFYVRALAAPGTVNTMPEATMLAFARSGEVDGVLAADGGDAQAWAARAAAHGIDLDVLGRQLQDAGDAAFAASFDRLLACIRVKAAALGSDVAPGVRRLGPVDDDVRAVVADLSARQAVRRLWQRDHTLWSEDPAEVADRLGWLSSPEEMEDQVRQLEAFAAQARADGLTHALVLGMGGSRDKLTLVIDERFAIFGAWIEQLIAESTGKYGTGIVPVVGEPLGAPDVYGNDRLFVGIGVDPARLAPLADAGHPVVTLPLDDPVDLGAEVLRWEIATALAGAALGINPFDQPDVEAAKDAAREALASGVEPVELHAVAELLDQLATGDYLAIQAYVDPLDPLVAELERIRLVLRDRHRVATTLGIGPRYLHSTGQLHKGGPATGVFLQLVTDAHGDIPIPGERFGFATLEGAQAAGDLQALRDRDRRAARVQIDDLRKVTA